MRILTFIGAFLLAGTALSGTMAADLPAPPPAPAPEVMPAFSWDGPYVGAAIGGAWGSESDDLSNNTELQPTADAFDLSGFTAGVYAGENWTSDNFLFGIEGDLNYANLNGNHDFGYYDPEAATGNLALSTDWQAFVKARAGVVVDRALLYGTVGLGAAHATLTVTPDPEDGGLITATNWHTGWVAGVGAEYAFTDSLIGRAEIDYASFGSQSYNLGVFGPVNSSWNQTTASVGLSVKF